MAISRILLVILLLCVGACGRAAEQTLLGTPTLVLDRGGFHPHSLLRLRGGQECRGGVSRHVMSLEELLEGVERSGIANRSHWEKHGSDNLPFGLAKDYTLGKELGSGVSGHVCLATDKIHTDLRVAIKSISIGINGAGNTPSSIWNEIHALHELENNTHVAKLLSISADEDNVQLVMERRPGGDLYDYMGHAFTDEAQEGPPDWEEQVKACVKQLLSTLADLHARGIAHRDIKLENVCTILPAQGGMDLKLIDFGLCAFFRAGEMMHRNIGTPDYKAPEVIRASDERGYGPKCDIWSLGILTFGLLFGRLPFSEPPMTNDVLYQRICSQEVAVLPNDLRRSDEATSFALALLMKDPADRPDAEQALHSAWLQGGIPASAS